MANRKFLVRRFLTRQLIAKLLLSLINIGPFTI